jgi:hypothetical protein
MTSSGEVCLSRVYFRCVACKDGGFAADLRLGIHSRYSVEAERLVCLAAASWSYDVSSDRLEEFCGLKIGDTAIREISQRRGAAMNAWQNSDPEACREFRASDGEVEFTTDGTSVNTTEGWRETKLAIFSKRELGEAATPVEWATRTLPSPKVRVAFAAIEASDRFGSRWSQWCRRLGILDTSNITVLADGARWIWEEQLNHLPAAEGMLDIFHAVEHVAESARAVFGEGTAQATQWLDTGRTAVLAEGEPGLQRQIAETLKQVRSRKKRASLASLSAYVANHSHHMHYAERLAAGRSIGSGQIEGACKNLIGRRLKQTGARWKVRRVNRMAGLCSLMYSDLWNSYWNAT